MGADERANLLAKRRSKFECPVDQGSEKETSSARSSWLTCPQRMSLLFLLVRMASSRLLLADKSNLPLVPTFTGKMAVDDSLKNERSITVLLIFLSRPRAARV